MHTFTVTTKCGTQREFERRSEAEEGKETHRSLCDVCDDEDIHITANAAGAADGPSTKGGSGSRSRPGAPDPSGDALPADPHGSMLTDPLDVIPEYMIDVVEGQPTINKRGYAVIAHHFDIVVQAEAITTAGETDHQYAEFKARAWSRSDGPENAYTGHATARASEDRRGIEDNLNEMAETRAMKRAVSWASGVGILAWEELAGSFEEDPTAEPPRSIETNGH